MQDKIVTSAKAEKHLNVLFSHPAADEYTVLVVDELDSLNTKKQDIIYNLFSWPDVHDSRLLLIALSNTFNLPEKMLSKRVASRAGHVMIVFQAYEYQALMEIIKFHNEKTSFEQGAIEFIGRKVQGVSGDARRALYIARRAVEIAERRVEETKGKKKPALKVLMADANEAIKELQASSRIEIMKQCSDVQIGFLKSIVNEFEVSGREEGPFSEIFSLFSDICHAMGWPKPTMSSGLRIAYSLQALKLILIEPGKIDSERRIRLNAFEDEIEFVYVDKSKHKE